MTRVSPAFKDVVVYLSKFGVCGVLKPSGMGTLLGDIVFLPYERVEEYALANLTLRGPSVIEVRSTIRDVYYLSGSKNEDMIRGYLYLFRDLARSVGVNPVLLVNLKGIGWQGYLLGEDIPVKAEIHSGLYSLDGKFIPPEQLRKQIL